MAADVCAEVQGEVIADAYSAGADSTLDTMEVTYQQLRGAITSQTPVNEFIKLEKTHAMPSEVLWAQPQINVTETILDEGTVHVAGNVQLYVTYLSQDTASPISQYKASIPFEKTHAFPGATAQSAAEVKLTASDLSVMPSGMGFNVGMNLANDIRIIDKKSLRYVDSLTLIEPKETQKDRNFSVKVYFVQKGDTLWNIAKRYKKKVSDIAELNKIENPDMIMPRQQIIIPA